MDAHIPQRPDRLGGRPVSVSYTLSVADVARTQRRCFFLRPGLIAAEIVMWALFLFLWPGWWTISLLVFSLIWIFLVLPYIVALFGPASREAVRMSLDDAQIVVEGTRAASSFRWDYYARLVEDRWAFYLVERKKFCLMTVPKRAFRGAADEIAFRELCASHLAR